MRTEIANGTVGSSGTSTAGPWHWQAVNNLACGRPERVLRLDVAGREVVAAVTAMIEAVRVEHGPELGLRQSPRDALRTTAASPGPTVRRHPASAKEQLGALGVTYGVDVGR